MIDLQSHGSRNCFPFVLSKHGLAEDDQNSPKNSLLLLLGTLLDTH
jgi:hypothetical protein